jgi:hypothetical protein
MFFLEAGEVPFGRQTIYRRLRLPPMPVRANIQPSPDSHWGDLPDGAVTE